MKTEKELKKAYQNKLTKTIQGKHVSRKKFEKGIIKA